MLFFPLVIILIVWALFYYRFNGILISFCLVFSNISVYLIQVFIHTIFYHKWICVISKFISYLTYLHHSRGCDLGGCCFPIFLLNCILFVIFLWWQFIYFFVPYASSWLLTLFNILHIKNRFFIKIWCWKGVYIIWWVIKTLINLYRTVWNIWTFFAYYSFWGFLFSFHQEIFSSLPNFPH